jgi:hypothetical protein
LYDVYPQFVGVGHPNRPPDGDNRGNQAGIVSG